MEEYKKIKLEDEEYYLIPISNKDPETRYWQLKTMEGHEKVRGTNAIITVDYIEVLTEVHVSAIGLWYNKEFALLTKESNISHVRVEKRDGSFKWYRKFRDGTKAERAFEQDAYNLEQWYIKSYSK